MRDFCQILIFFKRLLASQILYLIVSISQIIFRFAILRLILNFKRIIVWLESRERVALLLFFKMYIGFSRANLVMLFKCLSRAYWICRANWHDVCKRIGQIWLSCTKSWLMKVCITFVLL